MQYSNLGGQAQNVPFFTAVILDVKLIFKDGYEMFESTDSFSTLGRKSRGAKNFLPFITCAS